MMQEDDIVYRLNKRAEIRRQISTRKSVKEGKPDRLADLLEEAASEIILLRNRTYKPENCEALVAAIQFALDTEDGLTFLRLWNEGEFVIIRNEWPDAPTKVFMGAEVNYK